MKSVVGLVPSDIRYILDRQKLSATSWLGDFDEEDVDQLETAVQHMGQQVQMEERRTFMGEFCDRPEDFKFSFIQRKCIRKVAQAVRDNGIGFFLKAQPTQLNTSNPTNLPDYYEDAPERETLIEKLVSSNFAKYEFKLELKQYSIKVIINLIISEASTKAK